MFLNNNILVKFLVSFVFIIFFTDCTRLYATDSNPQFTNPSALYDFSTEPVMSLFDAKEFTHNLEITSVLLTPHIVLNQTVSNTGTNSNVIILVMVLLLLLLSISFSVFIFYRLKEKRSHIQHLKNTIREKNNTEKALRQSEENYQTLIKTLNEGLIALDHNFKIEFINAKASKILGIEDRSSLIGESLDRFLLTYEDQKLFKDKMELQKLGISDHYEVKMKNIAGDMLWVSLSSAPILDENLRTKGSVTLITDVTDRKKSEESYNELTSNLNQKIKQINCLYDISDISGVPGISFEDIIHKSIEIIPVGLKYSHDIGVQIIFDDKVYESKNYKDTPWAYVVPIKVQKKKLGQLKVVYLEEKPKINKDPFHFNEKILLKNISEKFGQIIESKKLEKVLRENQEKLQEIQRIAKIGFWEKDLKLDKIFFSDTFFDIADISPERRKFFDYDKFVEIIHPDDKQNFLAYSKEKNKSKKDNTQIFTFRIITNKGHIKNIYSNKRVINDEKSDLKTVVFIIQDITDQKISQEMRYNAEVALKTSEAKQHVLANMSYEMRTPINGIMGMVDFLIKTKLDHEQLELSKTIKESSEGLLNIINNILDLSMTETGKLHLNNKSFKFSDLIKKTEALFYALTRHKDLNLAIEHDPNIPDYISTDKDRLFQVITNLLSNAVENSESGSIAIRTKLDRIHEDQLTVLLEVADNSKTVDSRVLKSIYKSYDLGQSLFVQGNEGSDSAIAISQKLVELLGGTIGFHANNKKHGRTFYFTFLAKVLTPDNYPENLSAEKQMEDLKNLEGSKILYVEDKVVNQKVIALMLKHVKCNVDLAENGKQAIEMMLNKDYDVVLLDMVMPVMDGLETMRVMKSKFKMHPPVIALSANVLEADKKKYFSYGVADYISKPVKSEDLYEKLLKWKLHVNQKEKVTVVK